MLLLAQYSWLAACSSRPATLREFLPSMRGDQDAAALAVFAREFTKKSTFDRGGKHAARCERKPCMQPGTAFCRTAKLPWLQLCVLEPKPETTARDARRLCVYSQKPATLQQSSKRVIMSSSLSCLAIFKLIKKRQGTPRATPEL